MRGNLMLCKAECTPLGYILLLTNRITHSKYDEEEKQCQFRHIDDKSFHWRACKKEWVVQWLPFINTD